MDTRGRSLKREAQMGRAPEGNRTASAEPAAEASRGHVPMATSGLDLEGKGPQPLGRAPYREPARAEAARRQGNGHEGAAARGVQTRLPAVIEPGPGPRLLREARGMHGQRQGPAGAADRAGRLVVERGRLVVPVALSAWKSTTGSVTTRAASPKRAGHGW